MDISLSATKMKPSNIFTIIPLLIIILCSTSCINGYVISIDGPTENECFHEVVSKKVKLGFSFEVIDGGFYDVDVTILDPHDNVIHQDEKTSSGKFTFEADTDGSYNFCFSNTHSSKSPKMIMFDIDRSDGPGGSVKSHDASGTDDKTSPDEETIKLKDMVNNLLLAVTTTRHDVRYLTARDKVHRQINENSNSRILWWSAAEFVLLLSVSLGQVWYLKRFFETRRKI